MIKETEYDVVIVGAGPAGSTAALFLARQGIKVLVVSKSEGTADTPRAHIFNQRAMEVMRDAGLEKHAMAEASPGRYMEQTSWSNTLAGEEFGRVWSWGNKPSEKHRYEMASPCGMVDLPQSYLEPIIVDGARQHGAEFKFSTEFLGLSQGPDVVMTTLRDLVDGHEYQVQSKYLIGADGGRSPVVQAVGISIEGKQISTAFNVHIKAKLSKYMVHRPGALNWILNPDDPEWSSVANFRMVRPWHEWMVSMRSTRADADGALYEPSKEEMHKRLKHMIGDDSVVIEILRISKWSLNDQVAQTWQKGRVLCIGDAVHRHPPNNGLGSNTCISDAFNLAWKLAYVLKGIAGASLLDTLTIERKPVGDAVVRRAVSGVEPNKELWSMIGLTPEDRKQVLTRLESPTAEGRLARERLDAAFEATDLEYQALGIQMNQIYTNSPATVIEPGDTHSSLDGFDRLKEVAVSTYPGFHLPHIWIAANGQSPKTSTLDVCGHDRFTVLTGIGGDCWIRAASDIQQRYPGLTLSAVKIGFRCDYMDCYRDWSAVRGVEEDGIILVRPDHFVAWRYPTSSLNANALLWKALSTVLALE